MSTTIRYHKTAERPALEMWLLDDDESLIDLSTGYTFSLKIGNKGSTALLTKTTGIVGAAGAGAEPTGTPNVAVSWAAGELNLTAGRYVWQLTATSSALDRVFEGTFEILDVIT
jgi:hypothetical protein